MRSTHVASTRTGSQPPTQRTSRITSRYGRSSSFPARQEGIDRLREPLAVRRRCDVAGRRVQVARVAFDVGYPDRGGEEGKRSLVVRRIADERVVLGDLGGSLPP